jgi:hypothetical protein
LAMGPLLAAPRRGSALVGTPHSAAGRGLTSTS